MNGRNKEMEQKIENLFGIIVEFCEPYTGGYGTKNYIAEIFFLADAKQKSDICRKRDLIDLVQLASRLDINKDELNTGIICRHTEGMRATNQILFKDKNTLDKFKNEINFLSPQQKNTQDSSLRQNSIYPSLTQINDLKKNEEKKNEEKPFDYSKIFG